MNCREAKLWRIGNWSFGNIHWWGMVGVSLNHSEVFNSSREIAILGSTPFMDLRIGILQGNTGSDCERSTSRECVLYILILLTSGNPNMYLCSISAGMGGYYRLWWLCWIPHCMTLVKICMLRQCADEYYYISDNHNFLWCLLAVSIC